MSNLILVPSGFLLPSNEYFQIFTQDSPSILNENIVDRTDNVVLKFYIDNKVHVSDSATALYRQYNTTKTFDDYIRLVEVFNNIVSRIDLLPFLRVQATNPYLSNLSFSLCMDIRKDKFLETYNDYAIVTSKLRMCAQSGVLTKQAETDNLIKIEKANSLNQSWETFISKVSENKTAFLTLYRYILLSSY